MRRAGSSSRPSPPSPEERHAMATIAPETKTRVRGGARRAGAVHAADARLLPRPGLRRVSLGALRRGAVHAAADSAEPGARRADHDRRPLPAGRRRPGPGGALQCRRQVLPGVFDPDGDRAGSSHLARRLRPPAHLGQGHQHLPPAGAPEGGGGGGADRVAGAARPRGADQSQPPGDDGDRRARAPAPLLRRTASTPSCSFPADPCATRP